MGSAKIPTAKLRTCEARDLAEAKLLNEPSRDRQGAPYGLLNTSRALQGPRT